MRYKLLYAILLLTAMDFPAFPQDIPEYAQGTPLPEDMFIRDLYEIVSAKEMVYLDLATSHKYLDREGHICYSDFGNAPYDDDDSELSNIFLPEGVSLSGKHIQGNLGVTLVPDMSASKRSLDNNIYIIINSAGNINHRSVGIAHEFAHTLLFLRGLPYRHGNHMADDFIYDRSRTISKRLGYDN